MCLDAIGLLCLVALPAVLCWGGPDVGLGRVLGLCFDAAAVFGVCWTVAVLRSALCVFAVVAGLEGLCGLWG
ncbi:hypothetical protein ACIQBJ_16510 [Kitasatospora sp. NPDC088391]|uniref:hypothetical protein n=1 Tax=Kitasatospora sp. NPDC088391 TaxID=3364074 RepID=UPI0038130622